MAITSRSWRLRLPRPPSASRAARCRGCRAARQCQIVEDADVPRDVPRVAVMREARRACTSPPASSPRRDSTNCSSTSATHQALRRATRGAAARRPDAAREGAARHTVLCRRRSSSRVATTSTLGRARAPTLQRPTRGVARYFLAPPIEAARTTRRRSRRARTMRRSAALPRARCHRMERRATSRVDAQLDPLAQLHTSAGRLRHHGGALAEADAIMKEEPSRVYRRRRVRRLDARDGAARWWGLQRRRSPQTAGAIDDTPASTAGRHHVTVTRRLSTHATRLAMPHSSLDGIARSGSSTPPSIRRRSKSTPAATVVSPLRFRRSRAGPRRTQSTHELRPAPGRAPTSRSKTWTRSRPLEEAGRRPSPHAAAEPIAMPYRPSRPTGPTHRRHPLRRRREPGRPPGSTQAGRLQRRWALGGAALSPRRALDRGRGIWTLTMTHHLHGEDDHWRPARSDGPRPGGPPG